jgi:hypothetical protein
MALILAVACPVLAVDEDEAILNSAAPKSDAQLPRIHLLVAADTLDPDIGDSVQRDVDAFVFAFVVSVPDRQLVVEVCRDNRTTRNEILATIDRLAIQPADTIVFYWSGHGAYDENGPWFRTRREPNLYRRELRERLAGKHPRLNVVLSDCCNTFYPGTPKPPVRRAAAPPQRIAPLFDSLFFRSQGLADINSASENEVAMGTVDGGLFTMALAYLPNDLRSNDPSGFFLSRQNESLSWDAMVDDIARRVRTAYINLAAGPPTQKTQTVKAWALPTPAPPITPPPATRTIALRPGDLILAVNGTTVNNSTDYWNAVKQSPTTMQIRFQRGGSLANAQLQLRSGEGSRSGVAAETNPGGGVVVIQVYPGDEWPGNNVAVQNVTSALRLEPNDVIRSINGRPIASLNDYVMAVRSSPPAMRLEIIDHRTRQPASLQALLRAGNGSRFGVEAVENAGQGVRVTQIYPGYPGTRVQRDP